MMQKPALPKPSVWSTGFFYRCFKFFASLKLAIVVLSSMMIVLITGTFIESYHGADSAKIVVYDTLWFDILCFVLALNVLAAALDRLPWKKRHVGFVMTHAGIILILLGSFVTRHTVIDGQMAIAEGETEYRITLPEPLLYIFSQTQNRDWIVPIKKKPFAWDGQEKITKGKSSVLPVNLELLSYYPKARLREEIQSATEGPGVIRLRIKNSFMNQKLLLVENAPERGRINMGPAVFSFTDKPLKVVAAAEPGLSYLEIKFEEASHQIPLPKDLELPFTHDLEGTHFSVTVNKLYQKAAVIGKELVEQTEADARDNQAAQITLRSHEVTENHTVFARFPDFPTVHGMKPSQFGAKLYYRLPNGGSRGESHELRFTKSGDALKYQIQDGLQITEGNAVVGESVSTGWMDLNFTVEEYHPHAKFQKHYTPEPNTTEFEEAVPAIQVQVANGDESAQRWLGQGELQTLELGDDSFHLLYGQRRIPAGFKIELRDFKIEKYPGTDNPASFESDVTLKDDARGIREDVTISMNEPLAHRGYKVYQSGYSLEGEKEVSIFAVGKNPGVPYQYFGTIVMVLGISIMFYTKKFSRAAGNL